MPHIVMASLMSAGDIFQLSQTAWTVGRSFTTGTKPCPPEFHQVKAAADGLSEALQSLSDTIDTNGEVLDLAPLSLQDAISTILQSARTTLDDLEALVNRYRVVSKTQTGAGFVVEKNWSDMVLKNYKRMFWTAEKGDIAALRDMLQMHWDTISLTSSALQSNSLDKVERTVIPMASKIDDVYCDSNRSINEKLEDVRRTNKAISKSSLHLHTVESDARSFRSQQSGDSRKTPTMQSAPFNRQYSSSPGSPPFREKNPRRSSCLSQATMRSFTSPKDYADMENDPETDHTLVEFIDDLASPDRDTVDSFGFIPEFPDVPKRSPSVKIPNISKRRDSETLPSLLEKYAEISNPAPKRSSTAASVALSATSDAQRPPSSFANSVLTRSPDLSADLPPEQQAQAAFFKDLFRNSAKLFDDHASLVEITVVNEDEPDIRFNTELSPIAKDCRICVLRKRESNRTGGGPPTYKTSIWIVPSDFSTRIQQRLPDSPEPIPLLSTFQKEKVSLSGATTLRHHTPDSDDPAETRTSWINYIFRTPAAANAFQSAVFGRALLDSFRTDKSTVLHDGFRGKHFTFEEQMCGIETLRLWEEDGVCTPGAGGGVMALIHMSPSFADGWLRFWVNDARKPIKVKRNGAKSVRIKGLELGIGGKTGRQRRGSEVSSVSAPKQAAGKSTAAGRGTGWGKVVRGMTIDFPDEAERERFVALVESAQANMYSLPNVKW